jgi:hypothetical protein
MAITQFSLNTLRYLKVQPPMPLAPRIESTPTLSAFTSTRHILSDAQHMFASSTQHRFLVSLLTRPYTRHVCFACIVAANARVEFATAEMLDGDDVEG